MIKVPEEFAFEDEAQRKRIEAIPGPAIADFHCGQGTDEQ